MTLLMMMTVMRNMITQLVSDTKPPKAKSEEKGGQFVQPPIFLTVSPRLQDDENNDDDDVTVDDDDAV